MKIKPNALALIVRETSGMDADRAPRIVGKAILSVSGHVANRIADALVHVAEVQCVPCTRLVDVTGRLVYVASDQLEA